MRSMTSAKKILIIAGPNGAGKTPFANEFLPNEAGCPIFINADLIAAGLNPFQPEVPAVRAGRIMLEMIDNYVSQGDSFAFEVTLSGRGFARFIPQWQAQGYWVSLYFLSLPMADIAVDRVSHRVQRGGHHVPEEDIRRRFDSGLRNFDLIYKGLVDEWVLYDATVSPPKPVEQGRRVDAR